ncbi:conserved exported hypothetical protein [uncultured Desulfovibrio sp.]|uniref:DUF4198 domain-containing protein n=1 Tax=uncultured Desulfovibrio sp. TaxID=167968 RepID=A0A212JCN0_9BACT|nr:DUF4198 domain-containing protein [Desulfovibrio desulfuricans]MCB6542245.1 DUF4198 domain-containing protein [Desulfovibrio desulfuricans]MCB6553207.1 DUF4198 domain-containing protein [Desulfovibrio desulfuricans]MCB6565288.1 DUF4198 domain-containing protein [Desulfovibrio desulfuricans]MCB7346350.1 DUF4198 domain-containing protein [Desulfovibrio desulfuricans]MCQ4861218.1 DUF4198 domain-containing protein [Desulfovibrio desulfuricans]
MPSAHRSCHLGLFEHKSAVVAACWAVLSFLFFAPSAQAQVTLLVPSQPSIEAPTPRPKQDAPAKREDKKDEKRQQDAKTSSGKAEQPADASGKQQEQAPAAPTAEGKPASEGKPAPNGEAAPADAPAKPEQAAAAPAPADTQIDEEVDVLITMMRPFQYEGLVMDMPQMFAVLRYDSTTPVKDGVAQPERRDLLGDMEEIRYLNQKAWGANVALTKPGLYQFIIEGRPWWDAAHGRFLQHYVKTTLPVYGVERGWSLPVGQRFEIVPLSRPFGLTAPAMFSGVVLMDGKPLAAASVRMARINTEKRPVPTSWHEDIAARTNNKGEFSFVLNQPGWWCCMASIPGDPLKGPDGQPKPLQLGTLFWLYVDSISSEARKR